MAYIGNLFITGAEDQGAIYKCGVSYELSENPPVPFIYTTQAGNWQVEFTTESNYVVGRTKCEIPYDEVQSNGFSAIQEALDILSVKGISSLYIKDPAISNICVYRENRK